MTENASKIKVEEQVMCGAIPTRSAVVRDLMESLADAWGLRIIEDHRGLRLVDHAGRSASELPSALREVFAGGCALVREIEGVPSGQWRPRFQEVAP